MYPESAAVYNLTKFVSTKLHLTQSPNTGGTTQVSDIEIKDSFIFCSVTLTKKEICTSKVKPELRYIQSDLV